jgi:hypothetical protein
MNCVYETGLVVAFISVENEPAIYIPHFTFCIEEEVMESVTV